MSERVKSGASKPSVEGARNGNEATSECVVCHRSFNGEVDICCDDGCGLDHMHQNGRCVGCCDHKRHDDTLTQDDRTSSMGDTNEEMATALILAAERCEDVASYISDVQAAGFLLATAARCKNAATGKSFNDPIVNPVDLSSRVSANREMFEALEGLLTLAEIQGEDLPQARAALAKARGEKA